jgi:hypothetical protein
MSTTLRTLLVLATAILLAACSRNHGVVPPTPDGSARLFYIVEVLDGSFDGDRIPFGDATAPGIATITGSDRWEHLPEPRNSESIKMVLAFQLAPGKTRADFAQFKAVDSPWVAANNGSNPVTWWTERSAAWPFDGFDEVTFASRADFDRAYAGNDELAAIAAGLFGDAVLAAVVVE